MATHVDVGFEQFKQEIRPAVMEESQENAKKMGAWLVEHGYDVRMMDSAAIADALYRCSLCGDA